MIKQTLSFFFLLSSSITVVAMPPFTGNDYSGQYTCKGNNSSVGDYEVQVTLKLNKVISHDIYGVYDFSTESNNKAAYVGQIMAKNRQFAMTFKLLGESKDWFSTGMGYFKKSEKNQWFFHNTYYEPDGNGGNFGNDYCNLNPKPKQEQPKLEPTKQEPQKQEQINKEAPKQQPQEDPKKSSKPMPNAKEKESP